MLPSFLTNMDPNIYRSRNYVVLDFEIDTSHGDYGSAVHDDNGMLLASFRLGPAHKLYQGPQTYSIWTNEFSLGKLVRLIEEADFLVAHNAKYELMWLKRCGLDLYNVMVFDTKLAEYVLLGNLAAGDELMPAKSTSLDMCCRRRGLPVKDPVVDIMMKHGINPVRMPRAWLQGRCEQDVETTEAIFLNQLEHLDATGRLPVQYTRCLLTPVLAHIEFEGMCLDPGRVDKEYESYTQQLIDLEHKMNDFTGGINWRSPNQVAEFIYDTLGFEELKDWKGQPKRTKIKKRVLVDGTEKVTGGKRKTDKKTLDKLVAKTKRQRAYLELKGKLGKVGAALSKNLEFFVGVCKEMGGVFIAEFHQTKTSTHRLSSTGIKTFFQTFKAWKKVQFQNLPRVFKRLFKARRKGWKMAETDGSQLEWRIAVHLSKDKQGKVDIVSGHDVHSFTASVLLNKAMEEVTKEERQDGKPDTFKPVYGGQSGTPAQQRYYKAFRERYPELTETQESWVYEVCNSPQKRLITEWGLRYYWPYARISRSGYCNYTSSIYNYKIQALATAEIIPIAIVFFWHRVKDEGLDAIIKLVNTVHDSVINEIHPDAEEDYKRISIQSFTHDVYDYLEKVYGIKFDFVPLGVGITVGSHWSEGKEEQYNVFYDGTEERLE